MRAAGWLLSLLVAFHPPMQQRVRIVAMGDSTTAGTPGVPVPRRGSSRGPGRPHQPVRLLADADTTRVGSPEQGRQRRAQRSDSRPVRARRRRLAPGRGGADRGGQRRLPGPACGRTSSSSCAGCSTGPGRPGSGSSLVQSFLTTRRHPSRTRGCARSTTGSACRPRPRPDSRFADTRAAVAAPGKPDTLSETADQLHPTPAGYRAMAEAIRPAIERVLR